MNDCCEEILETLSYIMPHDKRIETLFMNKETHNYLKYLAKNGRLFFGRGDGVDMIPNLVGYLSVKDLVDIFQILKKNNKNHDYESTDYLNRIKKKLSKNYSDKFERVINILNNKIELEEDDEYNKYCKRNHDRSRGCGNKKCTDNLLYCVKSCKGCPDYIEKQKENKEKPKKGEFDDVDFTSIINSADNNIRSVAAPPTLSLKEQLDQERLRRIELESMIEQIKKEDKSKRGSGDDAPSDGRKKSKRKSIKKKKSKRKSIKKKKSKRKN